jgi:hypothetical protein
MRHHPILKTTLGLAIIAGASLPAASLSANDGMKTNWAFGEDAFYTNIATIQSAPSMTDTESGAMGPIRTEGMEADWSYGEGAFYPNIARIQSAAPMTMPEPSGAMGPLRSDSMEAAWSYGEGGFYNNIGLIQSGQR